MTLEETRRELLKRAREHSPYTFLMLALPYLEQVAQDADIRLLTFQKLSRLGLIGPALELIDDLPPTLTGQSEFQQAVDTLRGQPTGGIPWPTLAARFEANLEVALARFEPCQAREDEIRRSFETLDLFRCNDGNYQLSRRVGGGPRRWLPGLADWQASARHAPLLPEKKNTLCLPFLLEGLGFGEVLGRIHAGTRHMFLHFSPRIHVLEPNYAQFAVWLHLEDQREILRDQRVHVWLGDEGARGFADFHRLSSLHALPRAVIRSPGWGPGAQPTAAKTLEAISREVATQEQQLQQTIREKLRPSSDFAHYAERFDRHDRGSLRVLGVTSRHTTFLQYSMRDIGQSLRAQGHEFRLVLEGDDFTPAPSRRQVLEQIDEFLPDLILMIDHNRAEFGDLYDLPIPYCNWIQDELPNLFGPDRGRGLNHYDVVIGHISEQMARESGYPPRQCHRAPVPVNPRVFSNEPVADADRSKAQCDLSFVSNLSITAGRFLRENLARCTQPKMRELLEALYEILGPRIATGHVPVTKPQTEGLIQQTAHELGFELSDNDAAHLRRNFLDRLINIFFRHQPLCWAHEMGLDLHLYGRGWEQHPQLGRYARGVAANGYHLRSVFQASRINLQLFPGTFVHQRLLEGLASGGFFLIRGTPYDDVHELFASVARRCVELGIRSETKLWNTPDPQLAQDVRTLSEVIYAPRQLPEGATTHFRSYLEFGRRVDMPSLLPRYQQVRFGTREAFEGLVTRYLADDATRQEIAAEQRQRILATFTYDAVIADVFRFIAEYFADRAASVRTPSVSAGPIRALSASEG